VLEIEDPKSIRYLIYNKYKRLIKARINEPLFSPLVAQNIIEVDKRLLTIHRHDGNDNLIAITNVSNKTVTIPTKKFTSLLGKNSALDIITQDKIKLTDKLSIKSYQILWLK
jgi:hypothetical protein